MTCHCSRCELRDFLASVMDGASPKLPKTQSTETNVNCTLGKDEHVTKPENKTCHEKGGEFVTTGTTCKHSDVYEVEGIFTRCRRCGEFWEKKTPVNHPHTREGVTK